MNRSLANWVSYSTTRLDIYLAQARAGSPRAVCAFASANAAGRSFGGFAQAGSRLRGRTAEISARSLARLFPRAPDLKLVDCITGKTYESQGDKLDVEIPGSGTLMLEVVGKIENPTPRGEVRKGKSWLNWIPLFHPTRA